MLSRIRRVCFLFLLSVGIALLFCLSAPNAWADYWQTSIIPNVSDWPQHHNDSVNGSWCGVAALQAKIDWDWRDHYNQSNHFYTQEWLWDYAKNWKCSDIVCKGVQGRDAFLTGRPVGNGWYEVRKLNIAYDFGLDPHAMAWMLWAIGPDYYHYWRYDDVHTATYGVLWTLETYHEPEPVAVLHGAHWVSVIGYQADRSVIDPAGSSISQVRYADPLRDPNDAYRWREYNTGDQKWIDYFASYTATEDPDPSTGWYVPPPDHWRNHWVTVERDWFTTYSPDWGMEMVIGPGGARNGPIMPQLPYHSHLPVVLEEQGTLSQRQ